MPKKVEMEPLGNQFGKPDIERLGIFVEMPYMNGKGYVSPFLRQKPDKGRNIMGEGRKTKNGTQHGYFDQEFRRLYQGEAIHRPQYGKKGKGKAVSDRPFIPTGDTKLHSSVGDHYGTFGGIVEAFGAVLKKKPPYKKQLPNCLTGPGREGGPGYADICLSKYPEHVAEKYGTKLVVKQYGQILGRPMVNMHFPQPFFEKNPYAERDGKYGPTYIRPKETVVKILTPGGWVPTGPTKWQGGCHDGCFSKFPEHKSDRKPAGGKTKKPSTDGRNFYPQSYALKTMNTTSILNQNTDICVNVSNYKTYEPNYTKYLVD